MEQQVTYQYGCPEFSEEAIAALDIEGVVQVEKEGETHVTIVE